MQITKVELIHKKEVKPGTMQDGLPVPVQPEIYAFKVTSKDSDNSDEEIVVPNDPMNSHYAEVAEWYKKKKIKPFRFKFE